MALARMEKEVEERSLQVGWDHPRLVCPALSNGFGFCCSIEVPGRHTGRKI